MGLCSGVWRSFSAEPGFDPVRAEPLTPVLVDCLPLVAASEVLNMDSSGSPFYEGNRRLRSNLRAPHAADVVRSIEHDLIVHWQSR